MILTKKRMGSVEMLYNETNKWDAPYAVTHNRIVFFVDILGFKSCLAAARDQIDLRRIIDLVRFLPRGDYAIGPAYDEVKYPHANAWHRARTTTFSDCFVFTFPFGELDTLNPANPCWPLEELAPTIASIFDMAVQFRCLIRGGVAIGQLWHSEGFLIGPGLGEAYDLERVHAKNPRIILSDAAAKHFGTHPLLFKEQGDEGDGFTCFNFIKARHLQTSDTAELKGLMSIYQPGDPKAAAKWSWLIEHWQQLAEA